MAFNNNIIEKGNYVGIGSTDPSSALDVVGKISTTDLKVGTASTVGWLLTAADTSGNVVWQVAPTSGTASTVSIGSTITNGTEGSVLFLGVGATLSENNSSFFWNESKKSLYVLDDTTSQNTFIGYLSGTSNTIDGTFNTGVGYSVLGMNTNGVGNAAFGHDTMRDNTEGSYNVAVGNNALGVNTAGSYNVAIGNAALMSNANGVSNTAVGLGAMAFNTDGGYNAAFGNSALALNLTGVSNTAIGGYALLTNTTGEYNTAVGNGAMPFNDSGKYNVAVGADSLQANVSGDYNVAVGSGALYSNLADDNVAMGDSALWTNESGERNVALGISAMYSNFSADNNIAVGAEALYNNSTGSNNTTVGDSSMYNNVSGQENSVLGNSALYNNTSGRYNTVVGTNALYQNGIGSNNVAIGYNAGRNSTGNANIFIGSSSGYNATGNNKLYIHNSSTVTPLIYGDFSLMRIGIGSNAPVTNFDVLGSAKFTAKVGIGTTVLEYNTWYWNVLATKTLVTPLPPTNHRLTVAGIEADANVQSNMGYDTYFVPPPRVSSANISTNGTGPSMMGIGTYQYSFTYYTNIGETQGSHHTSTVSISMDDTFSYPMLHYPYTEDPRIIGVNIYRTTLNGPISEAKFLKTLTMQYIGEYMPYDIDNTLDAGLTDPKVFYRDNTTSTILSQNGTKVASFPHVVGGNTFVGVGVGNTTNYSYGNVGLGYSTLAGITTGVSNIAIGNYALGLNTNGVGNVAIGNSSGYYEMGSNKLYIANSGTTTPLIYGDFTNTRVGIGSTVLTKNFEVAGSGKFSSTLQIGAYTLPATDGTVDQMLTTNGSATVSWSTGVGTANTQTFTNKSITKRVVTLTPTGSTYTPNINTTDVAWINGSTTDFTIANPTGTPTDAQSLLIRINSSVGRGITFGSAYNSLDIPLPTATAAGSTNYMMFEYNTNNSRYDLLAANQLYASTGNGTTTITTSYIATSSFKNIFANATTGIITVSLPTAVGIDGVTYIIKKVDVSANKVDVKANGIETIDGIGTQSITSPYTSMSIISDNTKWYIV